MLIAAARRGWRVREVVVSSIPSARRRSRFRPVRDGVAIGAYLTGTSPDPVGPGDQGRAASRWGLSPGPERDGPARRRRARAAALATMATPVLLGVAVMQIGLGRVGFDLVTPLVQWLYACDRLTGSTAPTAGRAPAALADVEASFAPSRATRT